MPIDDPDHTASLHAGRIGIQNSPNSSSDQARFFDAINVAIGDARRMDLQIAAVIVETATPNQYEELRRTFSQDEADIFHRSFAARIGECLPPSARLYDLSVTRFGCVLQLNAQNDFNATFDRLAYGMRTPELAGRIIPIATSVGIGVACYPKHGVDAVELLSAAASGARASLDGGKPWCFYSPDFDQASYRAVCLLRDIGSALTGDQFRLVYQPKTDLSTNRCIGAEALLRWDHPTLGAISPDEFVPLVEGTTLIHAITDWALGTALRQTAAWWAAGLDPHISINVSMRDLRDGHFAKRLAGMLECHAVQPGWIDIEVTESALMRDPTLVRNQLDEIRRLGVAIEIDDYGTGQSGLSYLKFIPASYVKIPQTFIFQLASCRDDQIIVRSTIDLAHDLGLRVVAEGIRDEAALHWLCEHGCDIGQGNVISPPLEVADFELRLQNSRSSVMYSGKPQIVI